MHFRESEPHQLHSPNNSLGYEIPIKSLKVHLHGNFGRCLRKISLNILLTLTCFFQHIVIECKKQELNHYASQTYDKFTPVPLASKGWHHKLSRGDFFKINIYPDVSIV